MARKAHKPVGGRPPRVHGASESAPVVHLRLDSEAEAGMEVLSAVAAAQGARDASAPAIARHAIVNWAVSCDRAAFDAALARVRKRRERAAR